LNQLINQCETWILEKLALLGEENEDKKQAELCLCFINVIISFCSMTEKSGSLIAKLFRLSISKGANSALKQRTLSHLKSKNGQKYEILYQKLLSFATK
jgi:hypothetical protein